PMSDRDIFVAALHISDLAERTAFLDRACADSELRQRVERLLWQQEQLGSFLERPAAAPEATATFTATADTVAEGPGTVIGPDKLSERIGEGGMGTVWLAQQAEPVRRLVALKVIKAGMGSRQVVARFEAERQALALMDHPNVARVLDGGSSAAGRPFFVM